MSACGGQLQDDRGEQAAEKEFFLFFTGLMQRFDISVPQGQTLPSYHIEDSTFGGTIRSAPYYKLIMTQRLSKI